MIRFLFVQSLSLQVLDLIECVSIMSSMGDHVTSQSSSQLSWRCVHVLIADCWYQRKQFIELCVDRPSLARVCCEHWQHTRSHHVVCQHHPHSYQQTSATQCWDRHETGPRSSINTRPCCHHLYCGWVTALSCPGQSDIWQENIEPGHCVSAARDGFLSFRDSGSYCV